MPLSKFLHGFIENWNNRKLIEKTSKKLWRRTKGGRGWAVHPGPFKYAGPFLLDVDSVV